MFSQQFKVWLAYLIRPFTERLFFFLSSIYIRKPTRSYLIGLIYLSPWHYHNVPVWIQSCIYRLKSYKILHTIRMDLFLGIQQDLSSDLTSSRADILDLKLSARCKESFVRCFSVFLNSPSLETRSLSVIHFPEKTEELCCPGFLQGEKIAQ